MPGTPEAGRTREPTGGGAEVEGGEALEEVEAEEGGVDTPETTARTTEWKRPVNKVRHLILSLTSLYHISYAEL